MPDNLPEIRSGSVLYIPDFKYPHIGKAIKPVWMIYLGRDDICSFSIFLHLHRFTTQTQNYTATGSRDASLTIPFSCNQYGIFSEACVLDFNEPGYHLPPSQLNEHRYEVKGVLPDDVIRRIWNLLKKSPHYSRIQLKNIQSRLSDAGLSGLEIA